MSRVVVCRRCGKHFYWRNRWHRCYSVVDGRVFTRTDRRGYDEAS